MGVRLAALLLLAGLCTAWPGQEDRTAEAELGRWLKSRGAKLSGIKIEKECPTCRARVIATKTFKPNDAIMKIPFSAAFKFAENSAFPAEHARELLDKMVNVPSWNATYAAFWATQPGPDQVFTPELYTEEQLDELQTPELKELMQRQLGVTLGVFQGDPSEPPFPGVPEISPGVTLERFKHVAGLINSRSFAFYCDDSDTDLCTFLTPLLDMVAHADDPNAERTGDGRVISLVAIKSIEKGEELSQNYFPGVVHRPDMSLYYYGFVTDRDVPLLPAVDLPGFKKDDPFVETPLEDSVYSNPKGRHVTRKEHERLSKRLAAVPTTLEQDEQLLQGGTVTDWRDRMIIKYRMHRKRALQHNIAKLAAHLGLGAEGEEESRDEL